MFGKERYAERERERERGNYECLKKVPRQQTTPMMASTVVHVYCNDTQMAAVYSTYILSHAKHC